MKTKITILFLLIGIFSIDISFGQNAGIKKTSIAPGQSQTYNTWEAMQNYQIDVNTSFKNYNGPVYLYGVYHKKVFKKIKQPKRIRLAYENTLMYNTNNVLAGYHPGKLGSFNVFISGRVGWGYEASDYFLKYVNDSTNDKAKVNSSFGAEIEFEIPATKNENSGWYNLNFFGGAGFSYITPEKYSDSEKNTGTAFDFFAGTRYYLFNINSAGNDNAHRFYLQAKIGFPFTNGFSYINGDASPVYVSFGAGIVSLQSLSKLKDITIPDLIMLPETGFYFSPLGGVAYAQITQPIRLAGNLSLGFNGQVGTGVTDAERNNQQATSFWGIGADFRFFDAEKSSYINPYIGVNYNSYGYNINNIKYSGSVTYLRIGDKVNLFGSNWYLDANIGVPLTTKDVWIEDNNDNVDLENIPATIDVNIGLFYKFKSAKSKLGGKYLAEHYIIPQDSLSKIQEDYPPEFKPLPMDADADSLLIETRIYVLNNIDTIFKIIHDTIGIPIYPNVNVTNLRIGRYADPKESMVFFDDWSTVPTDTTTVSKKPVTLLLVGFDSRNSDMAMLNSANMSLVFNDLNRSRIFGYNYDKNNNMTPEIRKGGLKLSGNDPFYGNHDQYVVPLQWLSSSDYDINAIQNRTSWKSDSYKIAYAEFDKALFESVATVCPGYGVSVLFNINNSDDENTTSFLSNVLGGKKKFDGDEIEPKVTHDAGYYMKCEPEPIGNFDLSGDILNKSNQTSSVKEVLRKAMFCKITSISGYTDGVEFKKDLEAKIDFMNEMKGFANDVLLTECPQLKSTYDKLLDDWDATPKNNENKVAIEQLCQRALAWRRIRHVLTQLHPSAGTLSGNLDFSKLIIEPLGNDYTESKKQNAQQRKVVVYFDN